MAVSMESTRERYTTTTRGLRRDIPPMLLYERAKKLGVWNPSDIDFTQDKADFAAMTDGQRDMLLRLTSFFVSGEEAVTIDLLPLINVVAQEGRLEEEMYLTTFLWEEGKHVDFFSRFLDEVCGSPTHLHEYRSSSYRTIIGEALPSAMNALRTDHSPAAVARASSVYNMVVEGMLAETGYYAYFTIMDKYNILPGQRQGIAKLKQDESRHIAYGVYLLSRLMSENPEVWEVVESTMNELLMPGLGVIDEIFSVYEPDPMPFDVSKEDFMNYAAGQFQKRMSRVERSRGLTLEQINKESKAIIENDDA
ncbi:MAG: R2-like ligand-binding oxidase [Candidatus Hydrogenedens sp.]|nr:R2-like ligand-binding oxidase [Candidatus Hydrogenedens sp.]